MKGQTPGDSKGELLLRDVAETDLAIFFKQQLDRQANHMAAFTAQDPADREAFMERWARILDDETISKKCILYRGRVAGLIVSFQQFDKPSVSYWLGKEFWGQGIATRALAAFLDLLPTRPLYARAAKDNIASIRVLEKNGFTIIGRTRGFSHARQGKVEEYILELAASSNDEA